jgi:isopenicillin N synthase-like dioxygenase
VERPLAPVVDLTGWWSGDAAARAAVAAEVNAAFTSTGFLQVVGHGIAGAVTAAALAAMTAFFEGPRAAKVACVPGDGTYRGWIDRRTEGFAATLAKTTPADLVEGFVLGAADRAAANPHDPAFAPNCWPNADFEVAMWTYYLAARTLAEALCEVAERALGLRDGELRGVVDHANVTMRANYYARHADDGELADAQMALGAHTDYGLLTVLLADPGPGLEVLGGDGAWWPLEPAPGALVVNVGDALALLTNDRWPSTIHRVVPQATPNGAPRRSIALFEDGNPDAVVRCHSSFVDEEHPARYAPTTLGAHVAAKVASSRTGTTTDALQTTAGRPFS